MDNYLKDNIITNFVKCRNINKFENDIIEFFNKTGLDFIKLDNKLTIMSNEEYLKQKILYIFKNTIKYNEIKELVYNLKIIEFNKKKINEYIYIRLNMLLK